METVVLEVGMNVDATLALSFDQGDAKDAVPQCSDMSGNDGDDWISKGNHDSLLSLTKAQPDQTMMMAVPAVKSHALAIVTEVQEKKTMTIFCQRSLWTR